MLHISHSLLSPPPALSHSIIIPLPTVTSSFTSYTQLPQSQPPFTFHTHSFPTVTSFLHILHSTPPVTTSLYISHSFSSHSHCLHCLIENTQLSLWMIRLRKHRIDLTHLPATLVSTLCGVYTLFCMFCACMQLSQLSNWTQVKLSDVWLINQLSE